MSVDLVIVGAGPAGLAAACEARGRGMSVLLLDEGAAPGGRIWQAIERRGAKDADDALALRTVAAFRACGAEYRPGATVWAIEPGAEGVTVFWSEAGAARRETAALVLLATGTTERPMPFPGWTLPGVMTVGAAQIALKTVGLVPEGAVWIAGQGPLLLLYIAQVLAAGGRIAGVLDTTAPGAVGRALPHLGRAMGSARLLLRGLAWRRAAFKAGVPFLRASDIRAEGEGKLEAVVFRTAAEVRRERADLLLIHDGVIPSVQITRALGCAHEWDAGQRCWRPVVNEFGETSVPGVSVAGDAAGVAGWQAALLSGRIAVSRDKGLVAERERARAIRPLLDAVYAPVAPVLEDATVVCRCEEVTAGRVREAVALGCLGLNQLKAFTRCGMGPCQSRMCAPTAAEVVAAARGVAVSEIEAHRLRFPTKPLTLGELAALDAAE